MGRGGGRPVRGERAGRRVRVSGGNIPSGRDGRENISRGGKNGRENKEERV